MGYLCCRKDTDFAGKRELSECQKYDDVLLLIAPLPPMIL